MSSRSSVIHAGTARSEFENVAGHTFGVVLRRANNEMKSRALMPGDRIWLDEEEQKATANAPRDDEDNPFVRGWLKLVTPAREMANRRPIGDTELPQAPAPAEDPVDPAGDGGTSEGAPSGDSSDEAGAGAGTEDKVGPPARPGAQMTDAQEANAKAHAQKAIGGAAKPAPPQPAPKQAAAAKGKRGPQETVATPQAEGK